MLLSLKYCICYYLGEKIAGNWKNVLKLRQLEKEYCEVIHCIAIFRLPSHDLLAANVWDFPHLRDSAIYSEMT